MDPNNTSIIFVSGAWHVDFHVQPCLEPFRKAGWRIVPCVLIVNGVQEPKPTFKDEVDHITSTIEAEIKAGHDVVLIGHSLGGFIACEALNKLFSQTTSDQKVKVKHFILLASFIDVAKTTVKMMNAGSVRIDAEAGYSYCNDPAQLFYNDMSEEVAKPFVDALVPLVILADAPTVPSSLDWKEVPRKTFVVCSKDNAVDTRTQEEEAEEYGFDMVKTDFDHCSFISQPEKFVEVIDGILRS